MDVLNWNAVVNLIIFSPDELRADGVLVLTDYRHEHLRDVCHGEVGKVFRVGELNGRIGTGTVVATDSSKTELAVELGGAVTDPPNVDLVLALPRPQMLKRVLENVAVFGVRRLALIRTVRVERSYFSSPLLQPQVIERHLRIGLEQSMTTALPVVTVFEHFREFLDTELSQMFRDVRVLAEQTAGRALGNLSVVGRAGVAAVIGPEGGLVPSELREFESQGFDPVVLSSRVLRVETAVYALLAQLELLRNQSNAKTV